MGLLTFELSIYLLFRPSILCVCFVLECKENVGRINNGLVYAIYDYAGEHEDELNFMNGDELTILRRGDNNEKEWWWARDRKGVTGYVPCNLIGVSSFLACFLSLLFLDFFPSHGSNFEGTLQHWLLNFLNKFIKLVDFLMTQKYSVLVLSVICPSVYLF